jgi:quinol---cytochrome c reductase iron-sulfur subunit, bacillus type
MTEPTEASAEPQTSDIPRRGFVTRALAGVVGAVAGLVPLVTGAAFFFDPLLRKKSAAGGNGKKDAEGFINLGVTADALPSDGSPQLFKVFDDVVDAWNKFPNVEIGSVWLRRDGKGGVEALTSICPHLGCAVDFRQSDRDFYCPCHTSAFELDGSKKNEIPPRDMDSLAVKVKDGGAVWIKYEKFRATIPEKVVI